MKRVLFIGIFFLLTSPVAHAYSIHPSSGTPQVGPVTTSSGYGDTLNRLSGPFKGFLNSLGNVTTTDLPSQVVNPSKQIQAMIPQDNSNILVPIVKFVSITNDWLIEKSGQMILWAISLVHKN